LYIYSTVNLSSPNKKALQKKSFLES